MGTASWMTSYGSLLSNWTSVSAHSPGDATQTPVRGGPERGGDRDGPCGGTQQRGRDGVGGERGGPDLAQCVHQVGAGDARDLPNPVRHGAAVDVALRVFLADVRHVGQPPIVERAFPLRGERDGGGEGTGDRGRMAMRDGRGECGLVGSPGRVVRPEKSEGGGSGCRGGSGRVGRAGTPPRDTGPQRLASVTDGLSRPADMRRGQPSSEAHGMIVGDPRGVGSDHRQPIPLRIGAVGSRPRLESTPSLLGFGSGW